MRLAVPWLMAEKLVQTHAIRTKKSFGEVFNIVHTASLNFHEATWEKVFLSRNISPKRKSILNIARYAGPASRVRSNAFRLTLLRHFPIRMSSMAVAMCANRQLRPTAPSPANSSTTRNGSGNPGKQLLLNHVSTTKNMKTCGIV